MKDKFLNELLSFLICWWPFLYDPSKKTQKFLIFVMNLTFLTLNI